MTSIALTEEAPPASTLDPAFTLEGRNLGDILRDVNAAMKAAGIEADEYNFSDMTLYFDPADRIWPTIPAWVACYPVRGDNEGFYVHITLIFRFSRPDPAVRMIGLAKCYTWENAQQMAAFAATIFEGKDSWKYRT